MIFTWKVTSSRGQRKLSNPGSGTYIVVLLTPQLLTPQLLTPHPSLSRFQDIKPGLCTDDSNDLHMEGYLFKRTKKAFNSGSGTYIVVLLTAHHSLSRFQDIKQVKPGLCTDDSNVLHME